jgi:ribonuclease HII
MRSHERRLTAQGYAVIAGVDEAGRGALAGPVVAAAVVIPAQVRVPGVQDSKALTPAARSKLCADIVAVAERVGLGAVQPAEIDALNILRATHQAMALALRQLDPAPDFALIDGLPVRGVDIPHECIVKGDQKSFLIAAASIVAKVTRDDLMVRLHEQYPGYGFADHKGYGTRPHREALVRLGPCSAHRRSFEPVARLLRPVLPGLAEIPE